jgi:hypothetical protein
VSYKICYIDEAGKVVDSIFAPNKPEDFFWQAYINYPKNNEKLAFVVTKYDSTTKRDQTILNYIESIKDTK